MVKPQWLVAALPLLIHVAAVQDLLWVPTVLVLGVLCWGVVEAFLKRRSSVGLALLAALVSGVLLVIAQGFGALAFAFPSLIAATLFLLFARTLLPGRTPLVTCFARAIEGRLPPEVEAYTRTVTVAWCWFFLFVVVESALLAAFAPVAVWSFVVNLLNYGLALGLFAAEYHVRVARFPGRPHRGFLGFLRQLASLGHGVLANEGTR